MTNHPNRSQSLLSRFGAEGAILRLISEMEDRTKVVPGSEAAFKAILPLLEKAHQIAIEWDAESRRAGL